MRIAFYYLHPGPSPIINPPTLPQEHELEPGEPIPRVGDYVRGSAGTGTRLEVCDVDYVYSDGWLGLLVVNVTVRPPGTSLRVQHGSHVGQSRAPTESAVPAVADPDGARGYTQRGARGGALPRDE